jgi:hypothetical protein
LFDLVQALGIKDKQPDGSAGSKLAEAIGVERGLNAGLSDVSLDGDRPSVLIRCSPGSRFHARG